jgi:UDPglucose 6-dehydrogenase
LDKISIFGLGRVGLITATCLAKRGYKVVGIDADTRRVEQVRNGEAPFLEPKLEAHLKQVIKKGTLFVSDDASSNVRSDLAFVCVGTPSRRDGSIDLTQVKHAASAIGQSLRNSDHRQLVVIKSTVIPGTARRLVKPTIEKESGKSAGRDFGLCSNPEFLREGNAVHDTERPDRIVIGSEDPRAISDLEKFYEAFHGEDLPTIVRTTHENAELIKYANNAFLATKVSFINCIANIAERIPGADVKLVAEGIGLDQRIGSQFLSAEFGWGGSCLPKDTYALAKLSKGLGYNPEMIEAALKTNQNQWRKAVQLTKAALGSLKGKKVGVLGLAFKPNTDDMRAAVSIPIITTLLAERAKVFAYDPAATENARTVFKDRIKYTLDPIGCIDQADCCIVITEWDEIKSIRPETFTERMRRPIVVDGRCVYNAEEFAQAGIQLLALGMAPTVRAGEC